MSHVPTRHPNPAHPRSPSRGMGRLPATLLCLLALGLLQGGCALRGEEPRTDPSPDALSGPASLEVENQNFLDARIYVIWEGVRHRVGMVTGLTTQVFELADRPGQLRVEVDFLAGGGFLTEEMQMWPGEQARLVIQPASGME